MRGDYATPGKVDARALAGLRGSGQGWGRGARWVAGPFPPGPWGERRPRRTPEEGRAPVWAAAASSSLAAGAFTAPLALALGIGFQAVGAECKATRLGGARAKPLGPQGLLPGYPALPWPPAPLALHPPKLPPHPAWWPPRVQGCTGETAGFPVSQRCVSVAAHELRIRAQTPGSG